MKMTNDKTRRLLGSRVRAVAVGASVLALVGAGSAVAAAHIGSDDIINGSVKSVDVKDGTLQTRDLTTNNFNRFTRTENVVSATTPPSTNPAYSGAKVVDVPGPGPTTLVTVVLDQGTWELDVTAQFWHMGTSTPGSPSDLGVATIAGLQDGFGTGYTADVPDGGGNAAQVSMSGTIKIAANNTAVLVQGSFTGAGTGQAGASVQATQIAYVKQPKS
jgi:hypothetical protein